MRAFTLCIFMQEYNTYGYFRFLQSLSLSLLHSSRKPYLPAANITDLIVEYTFTHAFVCASDKPFNADPITLTTACPTIFFLL